MSGLTLARSPQMSGDGRAEIDCIWTVLCFGGCRIYVGEVYEESDSGYSLNSDPRRVRCEATQLSKFRPIVNMRDSLGCFRDVWPRLAAIEVKHLQAELLRCVDIEVESVTNHDDAMRFV